MTCLLFSVQKRVYITHSLISSSSSSSNRYINHPDFSSSLGEACHLVLDMYAPMVGQSPVLDELLGRLARQIKQEVGLQTELLEVLGAMDLVLATQEGGGVGRGVGVDTQPLLEAAVPATPPPSAKAREEEEEEEEEED